MIDHRSLTAALLVAGISLALLLASKAEPATPGEIGLCAIFFGLLIGAGMVGLLATVTPLWSLV
jgi:hypothetical protein